RRGSPGAGALGATLASLQPRLEEIANRVSEVLKTHQDFPGMYQISRQFPEFRDVLNGRFNDGGNDPGYNERVHLLEKLMYVAGTLRGHVELVLEQHAYWRAKLSGEKSSRLARRLDFDLAVDPAAVGEEQSVNETALAAKDSLQRELPSSDQTFKVSVSLPQELHAALAHIWEEQKFTDVDFLVSGQVVPAHKAVLASQSQYFESMLYGSMREAAMDEVELKDVPVPAFRKVLQFAYTGSLDMENVALQSILEVSSVADRFGFVSLKEALGDQLSQNYISLDTVLLLLVHSDIYHLQQLHSSCVAFIENKENSVKVLQHPSLLHLPMESLAAVISRDTFVAPEIEILRAVQRWKKRNAKEVKEIRELLECVRLSEFSSPEQIFKEVEPTGLLDSQTILAGIRTICKPCLTEMRPRGKKESNNNLFTKPRVVFDSTTPPAFAHQPTRRQQHRFQGPPPQCCVADTVILLGEGGGVFYGPHRYSMIIALDDLYIINCLSIKGLSKCF
ncbi:BTB/POZ domain-containing protein 9, partial [Geodia barretti]